MKSDCSFPSQIQEIFDLSLSDHNPFCTNKRDPGATGNEICDDVVVNTRDSSAGRISSALKALVLSFLLAYSWRTCKTERPVPRLLNCVSYKDTFPDNFPYEILSISLPSSKLTIFLISIYKHYAIDIADPSSMQDAFHMNFVKDLAHRGVSVAQWWSIKARNPKV